MQLELCPRPGTRPLPRGRARAKCDHLEQEHRMRPAAYRDQVKHLVEDARALTRQSGGRRERVESLIVIAIREALAQVERIPKTLESRARAIRMSCIGSRLAERLAEILSLIECWAFSAATRAAASVNLLSGDCQARRPFAGVVLEIAHPSHDPFLADHAPHAPPRKSVIPVTSNQRISSPAGVSLG